MQKIQPAQIENPQQITAVVAGPDGANRLFILDGQFPAGMSAPGPNVKDTFAVLLGPVLTRRQFVQASGSAALTGFSFNAPGGGGIAPAWQISSVDADWDDESGQVELRVEITLWGQDVATAQSSKVGYHVTILAEI